MLDNLAALWDLLRGPVYLAPPEVAAAWHLILVVLLLEFSLFHS